MTPYVSSSPANGVVAYEVGLAYIKVRFVSSNKVYVYTYRSAGVQKVDQMIAMARAGKGLSAYIEQDARDLYSRTE